MAQTPAPPKQETPLEECRRVLAMLQDHSCIVDRATHIRCYEFLLNPRDAALAEPKPLAYPPEPASWVAVKGDQPVVVVEKAANDDLRARYVALRTENERLNGELSQADVTPPANPIKKPVIIVHQDDKGSLITLLGGPTGGNLAFGPAEYGLILCDIARHVARALNDESAVETIYEYFKKELDRPTTKLEGRRLS
jgi:hypothetical protein